MTPSEITNLFSNLTNRLESIKVEIESLEAAILQLQILCKNTKASDFESTMSEEDQKYWSGKLL